MNILKVIVHAMIRKLILTTVLMLSVFTLVSCGSNKKTADSNSGSSSVSDTSSQSTDAADSNKEETEDTESKSETESKPQSDAKETDSKIKFSI